VSGVGPGARCVKMQYVTGQHWGEHRLRLISLFLESYEHNVMLDGSMTVSRRGFC